jgi:hypothetical protein
VISAGVDLIRAWIERVVDHVAAGGERQCGGVAERRHSGHARRRDAAIIEAAAEPVPIWPEART